MSQWEISRRGSFHRGSVRSGIFARGSVIRGTVQSGNSPEIPSPRYIQCFEIYLILLPQKPLKLQKNISKNVNRNYIFTFYDSLVLTFNIASFIWNWLETSHTFHGMYFLDFQPVSLKASLFSIFLTILKLYEKYLNSCGVKEYRRKLKCISTLIRPKPFFRILVRVVLN